MPRRTAARSANRHSWPRTQTQLLSSQLRSRCSLVCCRASGLVWISLWRGESLASGSSPCRLRALRQQSTRNGGESGAVLKPNTVRSLPLVLLASSNILPWRPLTGRLQLTRTWCEVRRQRDSWRSKPRRHRPHERLRWRGAANDLLSCPCCSMVSKRLLSAAGYLKVKIIFPRLSVHRVVFF